MINRAFDVNGMRATAPGISNRSVNLSCLVCLHFLKNSRFSLLFESDNICGLERNKASYFAVCSRFYSTSINACRKHPLDPNYSISCRLARAVVSMWSCDLALIFGVSVYDCLIFRDQKIHKRHYVTRQLIKRQILKPVNIHKYVAVLSTLK